MIVIAQETSITGAKRTLLISDIAAVIVPRDIGDGTDVLVSSGYEDAVVALLNWMGFFPDILPDGILYVNRSLCLDTFRHHEVVVPSSPPLNIRS